MTGTVALQVRLAEDGPWITFRVHRSAPAVTMTAHNTIWIHQHREYRRVPS